MTLSKIAIESYVIRAQKADDRAFEALFDHFYPKIFRYIRMRVKNEDAEDLTADTFLKVVKKIRSYSANSFGAWLFRIAHNTIIDYYRRLRPTDSLTMDDTDGIDMTLLDTKPSPEQQIKLTEDTEAVKKLLRQLPATHQAIMELRFLEDFNTKEIAIITGKSEGNIRIIQMRALRELRQILNQVE
jgi:RNA polymerase sigma-70 factor (ECF subfamily)